MSSAMVRALLADTISTMTTEELRNVIMETPDTNLEAVVEAVLAEKRKRADQVVHPGVQVPVGDTEGTKEGGAVIQDTVRKSVPKKPVKRPSAQKPERNKRKCES